MLAAGLMVALALGSHGEAPREVKFEGALLAQAERAPTSINAELLQRQLDEAIRTRPSLTPGAVVLAIGGGVLTLGAVVVAIGVAAGGFGGLGIAVLGLIGGAAGLVVVIVGTIMLIVAGMLRRDADAHIADLKARLSSLPAAAPTLPPLPPPGVMNDTQSSVLLARF